MDVPIQIQIVVDDSTMGKAAVGIPYETLPLLLEAKEDAVV